MADKLEQAVLSGALTSSHANEADPDGREPSRASDGEDEGQHRTRTGHLHPTAPQMVSASSMTRGWSGNTGPKGVLQDYKASHGKSGAILGGEGGQALDAQMERISLAGMPQPVGGAGAASRRKKGRGGSAASASGSEESEGEREAREQYRAQRLAEIAREQATKGGRKSPGVNVDRQGRKLFGHLREVGVQNFVQQIDAEKDDKHTPVVIHLYDPAVEACAVLNVHLSTLARRHPHTKFLKGLASELDYFSDSSQQPSPSHLTAPDGYSFHPGIAIPTLTPSPSRLSFSTVSSGFSSATTGGASAGGDPFADEPRRSSNPFSEAGRSNRRRRATDSDVLPTILWYRGGEFVKSLHAIERDLPDGELKRGEEGCREVQELLSSHGLISMSDSATTASGQLHVPHRRGGSDSDFE